VLAGDLRAEAIDVVVVAAHGDEVGSVHAGGQHLLLLQVGGNEDVGLEAGRRSVSRDRVGEIAGRGAGDRLEAELPGPGERHRDDPVLERVRRIGGVVLDPDLPQTELVGEAIGAQQRGPPRGQRPARGRGYGQKVPVAPDRVRSGLDPAAQLIRIGVTTRRIGDLERTEAPLADVARVERIGCPAFFAT